MTLVAALIGCGGGGGGGSTGGGGGGTSSVSIDVAWPERTRAVNAPTSALSVQADLTPTGSTTVSRSAVENRLPTPAPYTDPVTVTGATPGSYTLRLNFFALANAQGGVVGTATRTITLVDGANNGGTFTTTNRIATVTVNAGQTVFVGLSSELIFTARDSGGATIAVTPGSGDWNIVSGGANMTLSPDGVATGLQEGSANVTVTVDGITSASQVVSVVADGGPVPTWIPGNKVFYTRAGSLDPDQTEIRHIDPDGSNDTPFVTVPISIVAVAPNPNVDNQFVFAVTTSSDPANDPNARYAFFRNTSLSKIGGIRITDENAPGSQFNYVGSIWITPDGNKIVFTASIGSDNAVYSMNYSNGLNLTRLDDADDAHLSLDGTKIVYSRFDGTQADVWSMTTTGANKTRLTDTGAGTDFDDVMPQWSKDGTKITYSSLQPNFEVFTMTSTGAGVTQLTTTPDDEFGPSFGPDGTEVAYVRVGFVNPEQTGIYRTLSSGLGIEEEILLETSVGSRLYWTSNTGRASGSAAFGMNRNLRLRSRIGR